MRIFLLGIAHPVVKPPFQVQGVYRETALRRGCDCEEGQHVALTILLLKIILCKKIVIKFFSTIVSIVEYVIVVRRP